MPRYGDYERHEYAPGTVLDVATILDRTEDTGKKEVYELPEGTVHLVAAGGPETEEGMSRVEIGGVHPDFSLIAVPNTASDGRGVVETYSPSKPVWLKMNGDSGWESVLSLNDYSRPQIPQLITMSIINHNAFGDGQNRLMLRFDRRGGTEVLTTFEMVG